MRRLFVIFICLVCIGSLVKTNAVATQYQMRKLDMLPGYTQISNLSINNSGQAVGMVVGANNITRAVKWNTDGSVVALAMLQGGTMSSARGTNDNGWIVGSCNDAEGHGQCVVWKPDGTVVTMPLPAGAMGASGYGITNSGYVVGAAGTKACVWGPDGIPTIFAPLAGDLYAAGWMMNDSGTVIGNSCRNSMAMDPHATVWTPGSGPEALVNFGYNSYVADINSSGIAVGYAKDYLGRPHACYWTQDNVMFDLLPSSDYGGRATGVNSFGKISGNMTGQGVTQAVIWDLYGNVVTLDSLPYSMTLGNQIIATDINDLGQVVGIWDEYVPATGQMLHYAVLWDPVVPEPSSLAALLCGLGGLVGVVLRRTS